MIAVDGCYYCHAAPYWHCEFVGVEEVVKDAMNEITEQSQRSAEYEHFRFSVLGFSVCHETAVHENDN